MLKHFLVLVFFWNKPQPPITVKSITGVQWYYSSYGNRWSHESVFPSLALFLSVFIPFLCFVSVSVSFFSLWLFLCLFMFFHSLVFYTYIFFFFFAGFSLSVPCLFFCLCLFFLPLALSLAVSLSLGFYLPPFLLSLSGM